MKPYFRLFTLIFLSGLAACTISRPPAPTSPASTPILVEPTAIHSSPTAGLTSTPALPVSTLTAISPPTVAPLPGTVEFGGNLARFRNGERALSIEALEDGLLHFELSSGKNIFPLNQLHPASPMIQKRDYPGAQEFSFDGRSKLETSEVIAVIDRSSLCVTLSEKEPQVTLTTLCPQDLSSEKTTLTFTSEFFRFLYGLGEQFLAPSSTSFNWAGQVRTPGNPFGNAMQGFQEGFTGNAQFPVLYALNDRGQNYALFLDSLYAQTWNFSKTPWTIATRGATQDLYLFSGPNLLSLRQSFMNLVGRPPVPPKKFFGLWVSEYGYQNWIELENKLDTLRQNHFPVDGFVLDLPWYGGITPRSESHMGALEWDMQAFPDPTSHIKTLRQQGVGLMTIEEPFIASWLPFYKDLLDRGFLVLQCATCPPVNFANAWWGAGSMFDWTNPAAGDYIHDQKRQSLVDAGIMGHWTDLGEPEQYSPADYYYGLPDQNLHDEASIHNLYNFTWAESIARGYQRNQVAQRPFILSRSGTAGIQRFGAALWSGDIASNLESLASQLVVQSQMSFSGVDYFGSDIGGFYRGSAGNDFNEIYTQWMANSSLLDVPVRPHTENLCKCKETAPDRVGDRASNLYNLRQRYALGPYLYSLAHLAYLKGEPFAPPLVFYFQDDPTTRTLADEKLLGRDLLVATLTKLGATSRDVYLPAGTWFDFHTNAWIDSQGVWLKDVPAMQDGIFRLPVFARAGAILPMQTVDEKTMDMLGLRSDGSRLDELAARVYASPNPTSFTLYEDDGWTTAYQRGEVRTTVFRQQAVSGRVSVDIDAASGTYQGAPTSRATRLELVIPLGTATTVTFNGAALPEMASLAAFNAATEGWLNAADHLVLIKTEPLSVTTQKSFEVEIS